MAKGEIIIEESICKGCGYCMEFCPNGCIEDTGEKFTILGNLIPAFAHPEKCTACCLCAWMCPEFAITVYRYVDEYVDEGDSL